MPVELRLEWNGLADLAKDFQNLAELGDKGSGDLMEDAGRLIVKMLAHRIEVLKESPDGTIWPPNKDNSSTLFKSGRLASSFEYEIGVYSVMVSTDVPYASIHEYGATIKSSRPMVFMSGGKWWHTNEVTIPSRPFMGFSDNDADELEKLVQQRLSQWLPTNRG